MGKLTEDQLHQVRRYLEQQGLSFKPLQDEMMDHLISDLEDRMNQETFEEAWRQAVGALPPDHFSNLQYEVMASISKRFTWSQALSFLALALLFISTTFKALRLPFAPEALLLSFTTIAAALLTSTVSGVVMNKARKGHFLLYGVVSGIILMLAGFSFKVLHLPGADGFILLAVALLVVASTMNSLYVFRHASGSDNLLTHVHGKYTPGIERFLLMILLPVTACKLVAFFTSIDAATLNMVLLVTIMGGGLQLIALSWSGMEKDLSRRTVPVLVVTIVTATVLVLVFLGPVLPVAVRIWLITSFSFFGAWLAYRMEEQPVRFVSLLLAVLVPLLFLGWALVRTGVLPEAASGMFFNVPMVLMLAAGVLLCRKHGAMRTYMIASLSGYLFEYLA